MKSQCCACIDTLNILLTYSCRGFKVEIGFRGELRHHQRKPGGSNQLVAVSCHEVGKQAASSRAGYM